MIQKIKLYLSELYESFHDVLDTIFPYKRLFFSSSADDYMMYYHARHHKISSRLLWYLLPYFVAYIYIAIGTIAMFFFPAAEIEGSFLAHFFATICMTLGFFYTFGQHLKGPLLLLFSAIVMSRGTLFGIAPYIIIYLFPLAVLCFVNICKQQRLTYYMQLAKNTLDNKMRLELEELELDNRLHYTAEFDDYIRTSKNQEDTP